MDDHRFYERRRDQMRYTHRRNMETSHTLIDAVRKGQMSRASWAVGAPPPPGPGPTEPETSSSGQGPFEYAPQQASPASAPPPQPQYHFHVPFELLDASAVSMVQQVQSDLMMTPADKQFMTLMHEAAGLDRQLTTVRQQLMATPLHMVEARVWGHHVEQQLMAWRQYVAQLTAQHQAEQQNAMRQAMGGM